jgi:uncharacterized damage-inducible protein DinB
LRENRSIAVARNHGTSPEAAKPKERKYWNAFFGSLLGTLNHIVVANTIWLKRFATHPAAHAALDPVRAGEVH